MAIEKLPPKRLGTVLEQLEGLAARVRAGGSRLPIPNLTVHLTGGQMLSGSFIAYQSDPREGASLVLHSNDTRGSLDAAYVPLESIAALIVHHNLETLPALSGGRIAPVPPEIPGRLVLERRLQELAQKLGQRLGSKLELIVDWPAIGVSDVARGALSMLLDRLPAILDRIATDDLGRQSLVALTQLKLIPGEVAQILRSGGVLSIAMRKEGDQLFAPEPEELERSLLAAL
jgi:hypothetical protein